MPPDGSDLPDNTPGRLIAAGRDADVYDLGDGKVLRRYRDAAGRSTANEAAVMRHVADQGFPVPAVRHAAGGDLVMDHIDGPTMLQTLAKQPWKIPKMARLLATLLDRLAEIEAPAFLLADGVERASGESVLHLDLHPLNVLLSPTHGPTVIDWTNAAAGPPGFDAAMTYVVLRTADATSFTDRAGRKLFVEAFRRSRTAEPLEPFIGAACEHRLADPNTAPSERVALAELRTSTATGRAKRRS